MGDGGLLLPVRAHDREAEREVRGKHARQRGCRQGTDAHLILYLVQNYDTDYYVR